MYKDVLMKNLKQARIRKGFTQQYVADALSTSQSNITKYENGLLEPSVEFLGELADLYEVSLDDLFERRK